MHTGLRPEHASTAGGSATVSTSGHGAAHALAYRPDIDGLRAIAVLSVVIFHAAPGLLAGGFVGVDVFFVISGFLISTIVLKEAANGTFSILDFYKRRTLRIFPALFTVIAACFAAGWFLFPPQAYKDLASSAMATAAFYSNFHFQDSSDYFAPAAITMPLLHTWSLAVEEQFYFVAPGLLLLATRFPRYSKAAFVVLFAASLGFSVVLLEKDAAKAFYMLPSRAFELMTGTALAMGMVPAIRRRLTAELAGIAGLALIAFAVFFFSERTPFPGVAALVPCLGAALLIHANRTVHTSVSRLLSTSVMVFVGRISYSLYLWHWPILVFAIYQYGRDIGTPARLSLVAAAVAVSVASYHLVEQPARRNGSALKARKALLLGALAILACLGVKSVVRGTDGIPWRLPPAAAQFAAQTPTRVGNTGLCRDAGGSNDRTGTDCAIGAAAVPPQFLLLGDSHGQAIAMEVAALARKNGIAGYALIRGACPPVLGLGDTKIRSLRKCLVHFGRMDERLSMPSIKTVVIANRWASRMTGKPVSGESQTLQGFFTDALGEDKIPFETLMTDTVKRIRAEGHRVVLLGPVPELEFDLPAEITKSLMRGGHADLRLARKDFEARQKDVLPFLAGLDALDGVDVLYPHDILCDADYCRTVADGEPLYVDDNHLSPAGAAAIAPLIEKAITAR